MFERDNLIGMVLLGLCAVVGGALVFSILTGYEWEYNGPAWLGWVLAIVFLGGVIFGVVSNFRRGGGNAWPNPNSGRGGGWRRWFRRDRS